MEKKVSRWSIGRRTVASLLIATTMLLSVAPAVHAEEEGEIVYPHVEEITPEFDRFEGNNREEVAELVAAEHFKDAKKVIIVNRDTFPDALSATNISQGEYPVLYTRANRLSESTIKQIKSMPLEEVILLGGTTSIDDTVEKKLNEITNAKISRLAGRDRYAANANAVEKNFPQANHVIIASGDVYADALYGVSYANTIDAPVVLTRGNQLPAVTAGLLKDIGVQNVTIIGGKSTITEELEAQIKDLGITIQRRIAGDNRYIGSAEVAAASYTNPEHVIVASGEVFSDALVSAPLAQKLNAPILLVRSNRMDKTVENYLSANKYGIKNIYVHGGLTTIRDEVVDRFEELTTFIKRINLVTSRRTLKHDTLDTVIQEDDEMLVGETETIEGIDGSITIYEEVIDYDGREISRVEVDRVVVEPTAEIEIVGTKVPEEPVENQEPTEGEGLDGEIEEDPEGDEKPADETKDADVGDDNNSSDDQ